MQTISMDTIGPIKPKSKSKHDFQYILVMIDNFTRFVTLYPCKTTEAEEAAKHLLSHIGLFGQPENLQSDRGSQFVNDTVKYLTKLIGVKFTPTMAYSKEENSIVERANKEVMRHVRAYVHETKVLDMWVDCLPLVQRIMNAKKHSSINVSPAQLLFGEAVKLDQGLFTDHLGEGENDQQPKTPQNIDLRKWIERMRNAQQALLAMANRQQEELNQHNTDKRAMTGPMTEYASGQHVLLLYPDTGFGRRPPTKLHTHWRGPYEVISRSDPYHYRVRHPSNNKEESVHIRWMKPFVYDPNYTDPAEVAMHDDQEFVVERVIRHVGDMDVKKSLYFKVKYMDLPLRDTDDDLLSWKELYAVQALHDYLRANNLHKHIPVKFRLPVDPHHPNTPTTMDDHIHTQPLQEVGEEDNEVIQQLRTPSSRKRKRINKDLPILEAPRRKKSTKPKSDKARTSGRRSKQRANKKLSR
jgi:hypothetical protein